MVIVSADTGDSVETYNEENAQQRQPKTQEFLRYVGTHVDEFHAKRKRVLHLLGENASAWPPSGYYHEELLRGFLRSALPGLCSVNHGYIYGFGQGNSREIDVLVWDAVNYAPVFKEGDLCIVAPESVIATKEVSSTETLNSKLQTDLRKLDAIVNIENAFRDSLLSGENNTYSPIVKAIVYFVTNVSSDHLQEALFKHYNSWPDERKERLQADLRQDEEEVRQHGRATFNWLRHLVQGVYSFLGKEGARETVVEIGAPATTGPCSYVVNTEIRDGLSRLLQYIFWAISIRNPQMRGWSQLAALSYIDPVVGAIGGDVSFFDQGSKRQLISEWP